MIFRNQGADEKADSLQIQDQYTYVNIQDLATWYLEPNDKMLRWIWPVQYILGTWENLALVMQ